MEAVGPVDTTGLSYVQSSQRTNSRRLNIRFLAGLSLGSCFRYVSRPSDLKVWWQFSIIQRQCWGLEAQSSLLGWKDYSTDGSRWSNDH